MFFVTFWLTERTRAQSHTGPDTVDIPSGNLILKGLLWHPDGHGPFPTIIFCHGSYEDRDTINSVVEQTSLLGPVFAKNGYIFFIIFRSGVGLSKREGLNSAELMKTAYHEKGQEARNRVQLSQLETDQLANMTAGLAYLRKKETVDKKRIAVIGHSFGGSLGLLLSEREPALKAAVIFSAAGNSWDQSQMLRTRLITALKNVSAPLMIIHAKNDYSTNPGYAMDSVMNSLGKQHVLKIYPAFGTSAREGHNFIFLGVKTWQRDVFSFLHKNLLH